MELSMGWITLIGIVVVVALVVVLVRFLNRDKLELVMKKRKQGALLATYAEFVDGPAHLAVVVAIDSQKIHYENPDMQAYLELKNIDEIEYDDELSTGKSIEGRVLRVRSHGHTFEFVFTKPDAVKWEAKLPTHRSNEPGDVHVSAAS